jgi:hypothetical protein
VNGRSNYCFHPLIIFPTLKMIERIREERDEEGKCNKGLL